MATSRRARLWSAWGWRSLGPTGCSRSMCSSFYRLGSPGWSGHGEETRGTARLRSACRLHICRSALAGRRVIGQSGAMATLSISARRPRIRSNYLPDLRPRYVVGGSEYEGSWRRDQPLVVDVAPGSVHVTASRIPWHPIGRALKRRLPSAEVDVDIPGANAVVVLEFRTSRLWTQPGSLRVVEPPPTA
jgi:hypothetical protein